MFYTFVQIQKSNLFQFLYKKYFYNIDNRPKVKCISFLQVNACLILPLDLAPFGAGKCIDTLTGFCHSYFGLSSV